MRDSGRFLTPLSPGLSHVGHFETMSYRYKRTGQIFVWNYIRDLVCVFFFFLNISIIIADINKVRTILCSEMSPVYFDLFFFFFQDFAGQPTLSILVLNR